MSSAGRAVPSGRPTAAPSWLKPWTWFTALRDRAHRRRTISHERARRLRRRSARPRAQRRRLFERALTHAQRTAATATSGSNSSATGCSAWSSPAGSTSASRTSPKARCRAATMPWSRARPAPRSAARSAFRRYIRLGKQAREDRADDSDNVVGDVVEALIGALFLDGGLDAGRGLHPQRLGALPRRPEARAAASQVGASGTCRGAQLGVPGL